MNTYDMIVIGAGIGGLTTAALLARAGYRVLVLEGQIEPGGCASSFERKRPDGTRYVFDVGATLFAGFGPGGALLFPQLWRTVGQALRDGKIKNHPTSNAA